MPKTIIDSLYDEFIEVRKFLDDSKEISLSSIVDNTFKKTLAISAASYFEDELRKILLKYFNETSNNNNVVISFIKNKAITRQYHTFFDWKSKNANKFFALFGEDFKESASNDIKTNESIEKAIRDFIDLGNTRNELAHLNFANIELNKTAEEVYDQFRQALLFLQYFENKLNSYNNGKRLSADA
jgi:hypothetical protein